RRDRRVADPPAESPGIGIVAMPTPPAYPQLLDALDELRRQWRAQKVLEGSMLVLAGTAVVLLAGVATDNLFHLPVMGRLIVAGLLWGTLLAGIATFIVRRWLEDRRDDFFAALVEQKHPELRNQLINALQLGRADG